jgi:hypothetical protein
MLSRPPTARPRHCERTAARQRRPWAARSRRDPVEHVARGVRGARPDRHRQQHDVHHRKAGTRPAASADRAPAGRPVASACRRQARAPRSPAGRAAATRSAGVDVGRGLDRRALQRQVHPRVAHAGHRRQAPLDARDAARAMDRRQRQHQPPRPLGRGDSRGGGARRRPGRPIAGREGGVIGVSRGRRCSTMRWRNSVPSAARGLMRMFQLPGRQGDRCDVAARSSKTKSGSACRRSHGSRGRASRQLGRIDRRARGPGDRQAQIRSPS